jgi:hypothetical protein
MGSAMKMALSWVVQDGKLDWGFLGTEGETQTCAGSTCAYTNPSSPYGLAVLPLTPREVRDGGTAAKEAAAYTPEFVRAVSARACCAPVSPCMLS